MSDELTKAYAEIAVLRMDLAEYARAHQACEEERDDYRNLARRLERERDHYRTLATHMPEDSAGKDGEPDWRALYRDELATRFMSQDLRISRTQARDLADEDIARIEADAAREATQDREGQA